jgi:transporter family protein
MQIPTWLIFAFLGAVAAAFTGFFAKIGMEGIDSTLATTIRAMVGTFYLVLITTSLQKWPHLKSLNPKAVVMMILCGVAGTSSWLFEYHAMAIKGPLSMVSAIDKLSVPLTIILAVTLLHEKLTAINWVGVGLIVIGVYCVAYKPAPPATAPGLPVSAHAAE